MDIGSLDMLRQHAALLDSKGKIIAVNRAWRESGKKNGLNPENSGTGANYLSICRNFCGTDTNAVSEITEAIVDVTRGKRGGYNTEYLCRQGDEEYRISVTVMPCSGNADGRVLVLHDVFNSSKHVDERSNLLLLCLDNAPTSLAVIEPRKPGYPVIYVNKAFCDLTGYTMKELYGHNLARLNGPDTDDSSISRIREALEEEQACVEQILNYRKNGDPFWNRVRIEPVFDHNAELNGFVYGCEDITEHRKQKNELYMHKQVLAASHGFLGLIDTNYHIVIHNNTVQRYFGIEGQSLKGRHVRKLYGKELFEKKLKPQMDRCLAGKEVDFELTYNYPCMGKRFMAVSYRPQFGPDDTVRGIYAVVQDITERKSSVQTVRSSRAKVRRLAERLHEVREEERAALSRVIHDEVGQRLTLLKLNLSWLIDRLPAPWKVLPGEFAKLGADIDAILAVSQKISNQLRPAIIDDLGLKPAIEADIQKYQDSMHWRSETAFTPEDFSFQDERDIAVFRIVQEALANVARHAGATRITINARTTRKNYILVIEDNGRGIKKSSIASTNSLGLIGMRERAGIFGGRVTITRGRKWGTTVRLSLPLSGRRR